MSGTHELDHAHWPPPVDTEVPMPEDAPDELELVVEGELHDGGRYFDAALVMAKCPSKYEIPKDAGLFEAFRRSVPTCASKTAAAH